MEATLWVMGRGLTLLALVTLLAGAASGQALGVLHIKVSLTDDSHASVPVPRHALLISDNPATSVPRRVVTGPDGRVDVRLRPGNYTVESEEAVAFGGKGYEWFQTLDVRSDAEVVLELTAANADVGAAPVVSASSSTAPAESDPSLFAPQWNDSVVALWTPITRASGFVVDADGLVVTNQRVIGNATSVAVQVTPQVKVAARVLAADAKRDVAVLWIDPSVVASVRPVPLSCAAGTSSPFTEGQKVVALGVPIRGSRDVAVGEVIRVEPRGSVADSRVSNGGMGGPVFGAGGSLVGLSSIVEDQDERRRRDVRIVTAEAACAVLADARATMPSAQRPSGARLPVEPVRALPTDALDAVVQQRAGDVGPYRLSASDFDVAFITPVTMRGAQRIAAAGRTRSRSLQPQGSPIEPTDFGDWSDYFADAPPVLVIRVTPKLEESLWTKVARGAAYTQGVALPPIKRFKPGFARLRVFCGDAEVAPIQPFMLEQRVSDTDAIREGLYVFDADALGPHCASVTLRLASEKAPGKEETKAVERRVVDRIWEDFAPYRALPAPGGDGRP